MTAMAANALMNDDEDIRLSEFIPAQVRAPEGLRVAGLTTLCYSRYLHESLDETDKPSTLIIQPKAKPRNTLSSAGVTSARHVRFAADH